MAVQGNCETRFQGVRDEFERNFAERGEVGASVCVTVDGETVVDLHGGVADPEAGRAWDADTVCVVWSSTKGALSLCAHMLVARGDIDLEAPVASYWPEFAKNGKENIPVRWLLSHQSGLAALRDPLPPGGMADWDVVVDALAREIPLWEPGTRVGYHALTLGHLVGEVIRRVTNRSVGTFFREEVAEPLGLDFWIGLPDEIAPRVAPLISPDIPEDLSTLPSFYQLVFGDPTSIPAMVLLNHGGLNDPGAIDTPEIRASEIPSANGVTNARGLASMYRPLALGGEYDGVRLVPEDAIVAMSSVASATAVDATMQAPTRWSLGFGKAVDNTARPLGFRDSLLMSEQAFGHLGNGGSLGFADPGARLSFGYTMNKLGMCVGLEKRGQALVDATYRALGYRQPRDGGIWFA
jgi:CubicO group peptidase (beta-lactamase class C family)